MGSLERQGATLKVAHESYIVLTATASVASVPRWRGCYRQRRSRECSTQIQKPRNKRRHNSCQRCVGYTRKCSVRATGLSRDERQNVWWDPGLLTRLRLARGMKGHERTTAKTKTETLKVNGLDLVRTAAPREKRERSTKGRV